MDREEFINQLRISLAGKASQSSIDDNVNYYNDYIDMQLKTGKTEQTIFLELGNPRLLAKSIIESTKAEETENRGHRDSTGEDEKNQNQGTGESVLFKIGRLPKWALTLGGIFILFIVFAIIIALISLAMYLIVPIIVVLAAIWLIRGIVQVFKK